MREFSAAEDEESFHVFYPGEDEPVIIAKFGLEPDVAAQIRSRVVPDDAPGHNEGVVLPGQPVIGPDGEPFLAPADSTGDEGLDAALALRAQQQAMFPAPVSAPPPEPDDGTRGGMLSIQAPSMEPESQILFAPPELIPTPGGVVGSLGVVPNAPPGFTPMDMSKGALSIEAPAVAHVDRPPRELSKAQMGAAVGVPPGIAAPPTGPAGVGAGGRVGGGVKQSSERGGAWRESDGIGAPPVDEKQAMRDARAAVLANLAGEADKAAKDRDIAVQEQFLKDKAMLEQQNAADIARRDIEAKEMKRQIMEGKIDPTRLFSSMDGGRQAVTLISMVLGGLANGASGFRTGNVAVDMFDRMIDRDIAAQKDGLDRKQSMYRDFIQEGRDAQQAFLLTKAAMQEGLAAQLRLNASKLGSETAMMNAEQSAIAIESAAKANRDKAANDWTKTELDKRMTAAQIAKMRSDAQRQKEMTAIDYMNAQTAAAKAGQGTPVDREYTIPVAPFAVQGKQGVRFTGFDKVQSGKIRDAGSNAESLLAMLEDAKEFRRDKWSAWIPSWAGGSDAKLAEMFKAQIMGAINEQRDYGALDKGSQQVLGFEAINPGDILTSDATTYAILDGVADATKRGYANILRSQTEEGPSAIPSSLSAPGGRKAGQ